MLLRCRLLGLVVAVGLWLGSGWGGGGGGAFGWLVLGASPGKPGAFQVAIVRASFMASGRWGCRAMVVMLSSLQRNKS